MQGACLQNRLITSEQLWRPAIAFDKTILAWFRNVQLFLEQGVRHSPI
jgi:hypothetical protein